MLFILNALLDADGGFFNFSSKIPVAWIGTWEGVLSEILGSWIGAMSHDASFPKIDVDAAQSRYAVVLFGLGD